MPRLKRRRKRRRKRAVASAPPAKDPADRLSRLPDEILAQILSFLPAQEAVRTCVLGRAWGDVWKLARRLRITGGTAVEVRKFVDRLFRCRLNCATLGQCEITFPIIKDDDDDRTVNRLIRTSLECQVETLRFSNENEEQIFDARLEMPLISRHLTRLELSGVYFECISLNFDGCPALEVLDINECDLAGVRKIMSPSLKHLVITECKSEEDHRRFIISAPFLVSLWLEIGLFRAPLLESMPELVEAHVRIASYRYDCCYCDDPMGCYHVKRAGDSSDSDVDSKNGEDNKEDYPEGCVLLEGLAQAKDLELLADHSMYIFRRDLRLCPTFSNLKALVLNDYWCKPADCRALVCILEHAPVLENLTIVFSEEVELEYDIVLEGRPDATAESTTTTQCLKTVKVKCHTADEGVQNVLKFLSTLDICFNSE